jgi:hypothetical protein
MYGCAVHIRLKQNEAINKPTFFRFEVKKNCFSNVFLQSKTLLAIRKRTKQKSKGKRNVAKKSGNHFFKCFVSLQREKN